METFVDPEQFCGTLYTASGWKRLGRTQGFEPVARDYYQKHERPKELFAKELCKNARRSLQAEHLRAELAAVEEKVPPRCTRSEMELCSIAGHFKRMVRLPGLHWLYPLWSLLCVILCAYFVGVPRISEEVAAFAARLSESQRTANGIRRNCKTRKYPAPCHATCWRVLGRVAPLEIEKAVLICESQ